MKVSEIIKRWPKRTRAKAIREYCLECSGGTTPEVTLCGFVDCPLWGYRFGSSPASGSFKVRMDTAQKSKPDEFRDAYAHLGEENNAAD